MNDNKFLYERGFYITNDTECVIPFSNLRFWDKVDLGNGFLAYVHMDTKVFVREKDDKTIFLIGHAYNPFQMVKDEDSILELLLNVERTQFFEIINELTGIFIIGQTKGQKLMILNDAAGIQCVSYGIHKNHIHVASHTHMLEDVCGVKCDEYVTRLVNYKFYYLFGKQLPGDITPYADFKRLIPNHYVILANDIKIRRFWPTDNYAEYNETEKNEAVKSIAKVLHNSLSLIAEKWEKPAISMTGGCDSKTTLACADGLYDKFKYFSYVSQDTEKVDADAAHKICERLNLTHTIYEIPLQDRELKNIEKVRETLRINDGDIGESNPNDVRKRAFFADTQDFDVEVKSWVSECGRAYYNKRFLKKKFPKSPSPRYLTCLYKVFIADHSLIKETNDIFKKYAEKYLLTVTGGYPWQEIFFWEFRMASWNALVITGEHKYSFDVTIPYDNRLVIDMLLRFPLKDRIKDSAYKRIREYMNPIVDETGIAVTNVKHTRNRARIERCYLEIMSRIPF